MIGSRSIPKLQKMQMKDVRGPRAVLKYITACKRFHVFDNVQHRKPPRQSCRHVPWDIMPCHRGEQRSRNYTISNQGIGIKWQIQVPVGSDDRQRRFGAVKCACQPAMAFIHPPTGPDVTGLQRPAASFSIPMRQHAARCLNYGPRPARCASRHPRAWPAPLPASARSWEPAAAPAADTPALILYTA